MIIDVRKSRHQESLNASMLIADPVPSRTGSEFCDRVLDFF